MEKNVNLDQPLVKSESGLFLDPMAAMKAGEDKQKNEVFEKYNERVVRNENAPIPNIRLSYSYILTRAVPPKMKGTTQGGIIINQVDADVRMVKKLKIMSENVSDEQEVLLVGNHVQPEVVKPGEIAKLDFRRYRTVHDDHTPGVIETGYDIPLYVIDGEEYLLLDSRDILYVKEKK